MSLKSLAQPVAKLTSGPFRERLTLLRLSVARTMSDPVETELLRYSVDQRRASFG